MVQVQSLITIYLGLSLAPPNSHSFSTSVLDITPNDKQVKFPWKLRIPVPTNLIVSKAYYRVLLFLLEPAYLISPPIYFQVP